MRAVVQRVLNASVNVAGNTCGQIQAGLLVFVGIEDADSAEDIDWLCAKICGLRIFDDEQGLPNKSLIEVAGELLVVSQFTLQASIKKGNRPGYSKASNAAIAEPLYSQCVARFKELLQAKVATGIFGADMQVSLINNGPMTFFMDTKLKALF